MKFAKTTKKFFLTAFALTSAVVVGGTYSDMQMNSTAFMERTISYEQATRFDESGGRALASSFYDRRPNVLDLPLTPENIKRINGLWNIYNIVGDENKINFNAKFELIDRGIVRVADEQVYKISFLSDENTIALFKEMSEGKYEIIEARKIVSKKQMNDILKEQKVLSQEGLTVNSQEIDFGVNAQTTRLQGKYAGKSASGSIRISEGHILNFELSLNGEHAISFDESVEIGDGGAFVAQANVGSQTETVSGVIISSGKDSYTLRIATGEYQGTTVVFDSSSDGRDDKQYNVGNESVAADAEGLAEDLPQVPAPQARPIPVVQNENQQEVVPLKVEDVGSPEELQQMQDERKSLMEASSSNMENRTISSEEAQKEHITQEGFSFQNQ